LTLLLVIALLYLSMRGWPQTFLVLCSLPFAIAGSVWLLALMGYNLSTAVWVGVIAVAGVAAQTGIVMVVYLDEAFVRHQREGRIRSPEDVDAAVIRERRAAWPLSWRHHGLGLLPLLWNRVGADEPARTAAPVVGGLWSCMVLTLRLPRLCAMWGGTNGVATVVAPAQLNDRPLSRCKDALASAASLPRTDAADDGAPSPGLSAKRLHDDSSRPAERIVRERPRSL
jgi:Cu/Ag efflux pump CusA